MIDIASSFLPGSDIGPYGKLKESETDYRGNPAIGSTQLKDFLTNEYLFKARYMDGRYLREPTDDLIIGQAVHCLVLEPNEFDKRFLKGIKVDRRTADGKKAWAQFLNESKGRHVLTEDDFDQVRRIADSFQAPEASGVANDLLFGAECETAWRTQHADTGLSIQCRSDAYSPGLILDLKTTQSLGKFRSTWADMYMTQAGLYSMIIDKLTSCRNRFIFIAVEKNPPYQIGVYEVHAEDLTKARGRVTKGLGRLAECLTTNAWQRDDPAIVALKIPPWQRDE